MRGMASCQVGAFRSPPPGPLMNRTPDRGGNPQPISTGFPGPGVQRAWIPPYEFRHAKGGSTPSTTADRPESPGSLEQKINLRSVPRRFDADLRTDVLCQRQR